jgi:hypothetical protein
MALASHLDYRVTQKRHPALLGRDRTILTVGWMRGRLHYVGARCKGWKAAARQIRRAQELGWIVDTGQVFKPTAPKKRHAAREKFGRGQAPEPGVGGRDAQPSLEHSYWWRIYAVPAITRALDSRLPRMWSGAYPHASDEWDEKRSGGPPRAQACLSAWLKSQGLIPKAERRRSVRKGSRRWAFHHTGPP